MKDYLKLIVLFQVMALSVCAICAVFIGFSYPALFLVCSITMLASLIGIVACKLIGV